MRLLAILAALLLVACPSPAPLPPVPDADAAPVCVSCACACTQLAVIGCRWGSLSSCAATLQRVDSEQLARKAGGGFMTCADYAAARTVDEARALGIVCAP